MTRGLSNFTKRLPLQIILNCAWRVLILQYLACLFNQQGVHLVYFDAFAYAIKQHDG